MEALVHIDAVLAQGANNLLQSGAVFSKIVYFFAEQTIYLVPVILTIFAFTILKTHKEQLRVLFFISFSSLLSLFVVTGFIASVVGRARPFVTFPAVRPLFFEATSAFPSGHATFFFALATALYCHNRKWGMVTFILACLVGVARVIAGVHYPSDIFAGAIIGVVVSLCAYHFLAPLIESLTKPR